MNYVWVEFEDDTKLWRVKFDNGSIKGRTGFGVEDEAINLAINCAAQFHITYIK